MYGVAQPDVLHPSLKRYIEGGYPDSVTFDSKLKSYTVLQTDGSRKIYGGLVFAIEKTSKTNYNAEERHKRRKTTKKKGSTRDLGKKVHGEILRKLLPLPSVAPALEITKTGTKKRRRAPKVKPLHVLTQAILKYWADHGHRLQACELPVHIGEFNKVSQVDAITLDSFGRLCLWEVKTGHTSGSKGAEKVKLWQLQRHWLHQSCVAAGIEINASRVIQAYVDDTKGDVTVVVLS